MAVVYRLPREGLITAEDLLARGEDDRSELWDGVLLARDPAGGEHAFVEGRIVALLGAHVSPRGTGWVLGSSGGYVLRRDPDRVLEPDAAFVSKERMPTLPRGFAEVVPDLVAEVSSPATSWHGLFAKGLVWIGHGVRVVWLVNPETREAITLRPGEPPVVSAQPEGRLEGRPVLPELVVALADLFQGLR